MIIDMHSFAVTINDEQPSCLAIPASPNINVEDLSLIKILELFTDLTSGHINVDRKLHPFEHTIDVDGQWRNQDFCKGGSYIFVITISSLYSS